jgi:regulatory protein
MAFTRKPKLLDAGGLWEYSLKLLGVRAQSSGELRLKLERRAERKADVPGVLSRLRDAGYLNDARFAEGFATSRLENEGFGKYRVLADLRKRQVAPKLAERAVNDLYAETDEVQLAEEFLRRKYRNRVGDGQLYEEPKELAAAYRRMRRAGFSAGTSISVLKRVAKDPEVLDAIEQAPESEEGEGEERGYGE